MPMTGDLGEYKGFWLDKYKRGRKYHSIRIGKSERHFLNSVS